MNSRETVRSVLAKAEAWLAEKGVDGPRLSAQLLLARALEKDRLAMLLDADKPLAETELAPFRALIRRRAAGEPVAYILGEKEFYGLPFAVGPEVLVPRPETEGIVEAVREAFPTGGSGEGPLRFADLGTGSGCLAVSLASLLPDASGLAVDASQAALGLAASNAARNGVSGRLAFLRADFGRLPLPDGCCDLVVSNPPYVTCAEYAELSHEVADFEPRLALVSGEDGLDAVRALLPEAARLLRPGGLLLVEIGCRQGEAACSLTREAGFREVGVLRDLAGLQRIVRARA
ncbi:Protein-(glutamine-N5) methyltransferase, release factor-specific [Desulfovibrio sp. X2]|uniref:peptide chain release factor N(5)-glutamine methyltransferase n=1 Tax=Desulfovibrio sp. X2 TaxID=941449 RepID=UPI000358E70A|nr:peptide chain release factor N(5)-glutamine methyltransferase [Desulfovibrio sp. X2]EPR38746.1 Protein-(glutamine-N5) methyltransferase, release factor-specific [Desulfovibrio sp. X2]